MLTDREAIIYVFRENFGNFLNRRIALYGDIEMIRCLKEEFPKHLFVGTAKRKPQAEVDNDMPVFDIEDMEAIGIELVITVVKPHDLGDAYLQLEMVCKAAGILLYHIDGTNLLEYFKTVNAVPLTEHEAFEYNFRKLFWRFKHKNIVLYGPEENLQRVIQALPDYHIVGVMNENRTGGMFCGKRVMSYEQTLAAEANIIIVMADEPQLDNIYNTLYDFCNVHHIQLLSGDGRNLFEVCEHVDLPKEENGYFNLSEDDLKKAILSHEVISFGVFDTLLMYLALSEEDAQYIIKHRHKRRKTCLENMIVPRKKMIEMYQYAVNAGKKVYLISDSELPRKQLLSILKKSGISDDVNLILASEYGVKKERGLAGIALKDFDKSTILHIGASRERDEIPAQILGFDSFTIKSALDMFSISSFARLRGILTSINERSMVGLFIAKVFNNPFALYHSDGRACVDDIEDYGYLYLAPLITDFLLWMREHLKTHSYDDILFASRDGYLVEKLYHYMRANLKEETLPEEKYFLISRRVATNISIRTEEDIRWLFSLPYTAEPENVLKDKFFLDVAQVPRFTPEAYNDMTEYAIKNQKLIYRESLKQHKNYLKYIHKLGVKEEGRYALFDLVSSGTSQYYFSKAMPFNIDGVYLCWYDVEEEKKRHLPIYSRYVNNRLRGENSFSAYAGGTYLYANYAFLEFFITAPHPSVYGFDLEGNPIYGTDSRKEQELLAVNKVQDGIEIYFKKYIDLLWVDGVSISERIADTIFSLKDSKYTRQGCRELSDLINRDDMGLTDVRISRE